MSYKLGCKFFLLMLLSMLPILSHSQSVTTCNSSFGIGTISNVGNTGNTVKLVMRTSITLNGKEASCSILPSPVVVIFQGSFGPSVITQNGLTVNFGKVKFINRSPIFPAGCGVQGSGTTVFSYNCLPGQGAGFIAVFDVEYLLEGTSNTSVPNTVFFKPSLTTFADSSVSATHFTNGVYPTVNVPLSTAPTCSTTIDPSNLILGTIAPTQLPGVIGSSTIAEQKTFNLSINCPPNALQLATNFIPTFQFTRPLTANSISISRTALATDDLGFGFRVLAPNNSAVVHNTPITGAVYGFNTPNQSQSISKTFTVQYAKTLTTVKPGAATTSITILIGFQ
jgi:hypothetical protein